MNPSQTDSFSLLGERAVLADQARACQCELASIQKAARMKKLCVTRELQQRAEAICTVKIEYVFSDQFDQLNACDQILIPLQKLCAVLNPDTDSESLDFTSQYSQLYSVPLLEKEQEPVLFKGMNYLKYRAAVLREEIDLKSPCVGLLDRIEQKLKDAQRIRDYIIQANLRLVVSIAKGLTDRANLFDDIVSDGQMPLIRAVEIFDVERGNRFSTYGTWAVRNFLFRSTKQRRKYRSTFLSGVESVAMGLSDFRSSQRSYESYHYTIHGVLKKVLESLDEREQMILKRRFGLHQSGTPQKFREIAEDLGVSTERVRQLTIRSLKRLREAVEEQNLEIPEII
ncbi:MAG: sigma-70 family RNA polymerase sigma factor [Planctomycetes bacterium]|nr:sigma-70 family RNA polymerase sigma factor [Planctomycetota bacterium]MCH9724480.1 sigma-70 family RNA polymerase sigma factor [Planctomycetota bacterium]MCH9774861.1 sigma-70 family RNA polymerase sigma factor [Planctomycetota bacterium]